MALGNLEQDCAMQMQCTTFHSEGARAISASTMNRSGRARAVNASTSVHGREARAADASSMSCYMKVRATNMFKILSEHAYSQWLDHLIIWALLKDAPIQKKASNTLLRDQKQTTVHCPMHQPKQPTMRQSATCRAATADWQLVTAIRQTIPKRVRQTRTCPQMPQKPLATGANATLVPLNKRHWGQPMPGHLEAKEEVVEMKVSAQPVTMVMKALAQHKPQHSGYTPCSKSKVATGTRAVIDRAKSQTTIRKCFSQGENHRNPRGDATPNNRGRGTKTSMLPGTRREPETTPITPILRQCSVSQTRNARH